MLLESERERLWPFRMARESAAEVLFLEALFATFTVRGAGDGRRERSSCGWIGDLCPRLLLFDIG
jgi:hypothetical protein